CGLFSCFKQVIFRGAFMVGTWAPFTNQKLYLARLQFDQMSVPAAGGNPALKESARQAGLFLLHGAWLGLLNEIGESFNLSKMRLLSLADLEKSLGATNSEVSALLNLYENPQSWLRLLIGEQEACLAPHPKPEAQIPVELSLTAPGEGLSRYQLMMQDLKDYVIAFRERAQEW